MSDPIEHLSFEAPDADELIALFPGYEFEGLIAVGGMGAVYCATQKSLDRSIALKILPKELSKDAAFCEGFEAEAKAMAKLNHPNLIGVYDFGEAGGMLFIIMEYVAGHSIFHAANGQAIDATEVIRLVTGICSGLAHAHEHGIVHRDIKPSNILLDLNANPKIGDFGLARPIDRKVRDGEEIFGTPHYTAPEVVNDPQSVDYRADLFSVGVMLHELLTGKLPADDLRPPSAIRSCDPRFDAIVKRATEADPSLRYTSALEISNDLALITKAVTPQIKPVVVSPVTQKTGGPRLAAPLQPRKIVERKESSSATTVLAAFFLLALAAAAFWVLKKKPTPVAEPIAVPVPSAASTVGDEKPLLADSKLPEVAKVNLPNSAENEKSQLDLKLPEQAPAVQPKSNVEEFFAKARKIMRERAKSELLRHSATLKNNFEDFGKALNRSARELGDRRAYIQGQINSKMTTWSADNYRIPKKMDESLAEVPRLDDLHEQFLKSELAADNVLNQSLKSHAAIYVFGLEKQIERLKANNDVAAIGLVAAEIKLTQEKANYFSAILQGLDPAAD